MATSTSSCVNEHTHKYGSMMCLGVNLSLEMEPRVLFFQKLSIVRIVSEMLAGEIAVHQANRHISGLIDSIHNV